MYKVNCTTLRQNPVTLARALTIFKNERKAHLTRLGPHASKPSSSHVLTTQQVQDVVLATLQANANDRSKPWRRDDQHAPNSDRSDRSKAWRQDKDNGPTADQTVCFPRHCTTPDDRCLFLVCKAKGACYNHQKGSCYLKERCRFSHTTSVNLVQASERSSAGQEIHLLTTVVCPPELKHGPGDPKRGGDDDACDNAPQSSSSSDFSDDFQYAMNPDHTGAESDQFPFFDDDFPGPELDYTGNAYV